VAARVFIRRARTRIIGFIASAAVLRFPFPQTAPRRLDQTGPQISEAAQPQQLGII
jgi:hypothetical protein